MNPNHGNGNEPLDLNLHDLVDGGDGGVSRETIPEISSDPVKAFGLQSNPFADNVNPEFFYRTEAHEEAFLAMKRCIDTHVSLGLTTAISGTGKTMLTQVLIQELDPRTFQPTLVLAYPGMSRTALLKEIAAELKIEGLSKRPSVHDLIWSIQGHIIGMYLKGVRMVLIIDEVHFLGADSLHILRTLSNIEVPDQKLVTILLFGEQSFLNKLKQPAFRSVFSRMFARTEIRPLRAGEIAQYIKFRLLMTGGRTDLFADDAYEPLESISQGIPREINRVCFNALVWAARQHESRITGDTLNRLHEAGTI